MADASGKAPMTREKMAQELGAELSTLKEFSDLAGKLLADVMSAKMGDVTFSTTEETKRLLALLPEYKTSVGKVRAALKARTAQRNKEV
jgi:hypothetical protein